MGGLRKIETNLPNISAGRFPTSSLARIVAPFLLPEYIDKALYLDADILIRGPLDEFYYKDIKNKGILAVPDVFLDNPSAYHMQRMKLERPFRYIISGVLLYNLKVLREKYSYDDTMEALRSYQPVSEFVDQDFINDFFRNEIEYGNIIYNCPPYWAADIVAKKFISRKCKIKVVHYMGKVKPWHETYSLRYFLIYRKAWNSIFPKQKLSELNYLKNIYKHFIGCK